MAENKVKTAAWGVGITAVTVVVTLYVTSLFENVEAGAAALDQQQITDAVNLALDAKLVATINGVTMTHGEALSLLHTKADANAVALGVLMRE